MAKIINTRILPVLTVCLLSCTALAGSAQAGWFDSGSDKKDAAAKSDDAQPDAGKAKPGMDLDSAVQQAQLLRLSGNYPEAINHLSQLMLVAADDGRVVSEYGKTLAAMGRAQEAVNFLTRAQQLKGNDWTIYNALGVACDELGKQDEARAAYEHALTLKPGEASVLSNYALSRMLAKDPEGAHALMARAQAAGGGADPKIARNIALVDKLAAPEAPQAVAKAEPVAAPRAPVAVAQMPAPRIAQSQPFVNMPAPSAAPRALQPAAAPGLIQARPEMMAARVQPQGVVMQRVPDDPQAGPVITLHMPAAKKPAARPVAKNAAKPAIAAENQANTLQEKADAIAKTLNGKPAAIAAAKAQAEKPAAPKAPTPKAFAKAEARPAETKPADAKAVPVKAVAKKDAIPALRLSANAY